MGKITAIHYIKAKYYLYANNKIIIELETLCIIQIKTSLITHIKGTWVKQHSASLGNELLQRTQFSKQATSLFTEEKWLEH